MVSPSKITILRWCLVVVMLALSVYLLADNAALRRDVRRARRAVAVNHEWAVHYLGKYRECIESYQRQIKADAKTRAMMEGK